MQVSNQTEWSVAIPWIPDNAIARSGYFYRLLYVN